MSSIYHLTIKFEQPSLVNSPEGHFIQKRSFVASIFARAMQIFEFSIDNNNKIQVIDAYGNMQPSTHICPPTIDEMMNIIRQVKNSQLNINMKY